uniref:Reverse transcriptase domain-containing protein n=1 Tax=Tanacetum cinerariifolium TaxID=118510 RepID=A0A699HJ76_TANCI|nr:reverse transcriptase domain-containing protein [Tanacetum cinerariifolium]
METRSSSRLVGNPSSNLTLSTNPNSKGRNRRRSKQRIEDFNLEELSPPIVTMSDQHTMAQLLQAHIEGYEDAIVIPAITADNFELKHGLFTLVQNKQLFEHDKEDPHTHVRYFNKEFSCELAHIDPIPPGNEEADFDLEEEIRLVEKLLYDNSSPRPLKELNAEITDMILESLSPSHIPVEDSDSHMEEIDLFLSTDDLMPPGIENDDYDSERKINLFEELLSNDPFSLPENESSNFNHHDDLSFPRPPPEPPDVEVFFDFEPDTGVLTAKMVEDISEHYVLMPKVLPSQPALCPNIDTLLLFSSENQDKVFKPGILSYLLIYHQDKITFDFFENPMMMYGGDIPLLDAPIFNSIPFDQAQVWGIESGSRLDEQK